MSDDATQMLVEPNLAQGEFFDDGSFGVELANLDEPETRHGKYTGAELERRVALRDEVVRALAEGMGIQRICQRLRAKGVSIGEHSVMALAQRRADLVAMEKKQLSQQLSRILKLSADTFEEALIAGGIAPGQIPVAFGIFADKKAALDGDAGLVIEHKHTFGGSVEDFTRRLDEMKRARVGTLDLHSEESSVKPKEIG